ncbi:MAG: DMT family transporter [Desulfobacterales bacterium]|jgi:transporter family-2 protein|nr:DMT family transporter [Desulfobacterales bacterium]
MRLYWLAGIVAAGGVATALQAHFMGLLDRRIGTLESVFITYFSGGLLIGVIMLVQRGGNLGAGEAAPWYAYTSGVLGLIIVGTLGFSTPRLGLVAAFTVFIVAQVLMGVLIDHFGLIGADPRPLTPARAAGVVVVLAGLWLILRD